ncbi:putative tartrate dehydrogenase/decarboxylase TtuC' [compost metagenome]
MFEPVHGSAPDIQGQNLANPIGQIWTAKLMLEHFGEHEMADKLLKVVEDVTDSGIKTRDIGGTSTTTEVTSEICKRLKQ